MAGESIETLLKAQAFKEVTWGTAGTPTISLLGITSCALEGGLITDETKEIRGTLCQGYRADPVEDNVKGKIAGIATYEHLLYWLEGLLGVATPSGANPYVRAYDAPLTAVPVRRMQTIVYGDATNCYKATGIIPVKFGIKIPPKGYVTWSAEVIGKTLSTGTLAALVDETTNAVMASQFALYVDLWGGTIGSTAVATTLIDAELGVDSGAFLEQLPGALTPSRYVENGSDGWKGTLKATMVFNTTSKAYVDAIIGASAAFNKQIRLKFTDTPRILQFDFAGRSATPVEIFTTADGRIAAKLQLERQYNTTLANWFKVSSTNGVAALA